MREKCHPDTEEKLWTTVDSQKSKISFCNVTESIKG